MADALYGYHEGSVRTWWAIARALDTPIGDLMSHLDDEDTPIVVPSSMTATARRRLGLW